jgi:hypothetical protein
LASAETEFHLQFANTGAIVSLLYQQLDIDVTAQEMTGSSAATGAGATTGLAGNIPPAVLAKQGDALLVVRGDLTERWPGKGWIVDELAKGA